MKTRIAFGILFVISLVANLALSAPFLARVLAQRGVVGALTSPVVLIAVAVAIALQLVGHVLRSVKHRALLAEIRPIARRQVFRGQMIGFMFNVLLPFRLGELMRAHYIGRAVQVSRSAVFATILLERCVDVAVLGLAGGAASLVLLVQGAPSGGFLVLLGAALVLMLLAVALLVVGFREPEWFLRAVLLVSGLFNERIRNRVRQSAWSFSHALRYALSNGRTVRRYLVLSLVMWAAYGLSVLALVVPLLPPTAAPASWLAFLTAPYLGISTTAGPAYITQFVSRFEAMALPVLHDGQGALTLALAVWVLLVVPCVPIGAAFLLRRRLVEHPDAKPAAALLRNKLFRDVDTSAEFAHYLAAHYEGETLSRVISREEAAGRFTIVRTLKGGSNATTMLAWQGDRLVVKKVTLRQFEDKLASQHEWLTRRAHHPEIVDVVGEQRGAHHYAIDLDYREQYVPFFEFLHANERDVAWDVLERMLTFMDAAVYSGRPVSDREGRLDEYIGTKVLGKVADAASTSGAISRLLGYETLEVNGRSLLNFPHIVERIQASARARADLLEFEDGPIHGDLTVDNIMVDRASRRFMVIDPNNENSISDPIVDHAKLLQSLHSGYEFLLLHDEVRIAGPVVSFEERKSAHYEFLFDRLSSWFAERLTPARRRALLFHEAVHYTRMLTYRANIDPETAAVYYCIAVRLFNDFLAQYDRPAEAEVRALELVAG